VEEKRQEQKVLVWHLLSGSKALLTSLWELWCSPLHDVLSAPALLSVAPSEKLPDLPPGRMWILQREELEKLHPWVGCGCHHKETCNSFHSDHRFHDWRSLVTLSDAEPRVACRYTSVCEQPAFRLEVSFALFCCPSLPLSFRPLTSSPTSDTLRTLVLVTQAKRTSEQKRGKLGASRWLCQ